MATPDKSRTGADDLTLRRELLRQGSTDADIRRGLRERTIERVWRGGYVPAGADDAVDDVAARENRYRAMIHTAVSAGGPDRHLSHQSAATILDIPLLHKDISTVHFTAERTGRASAGLVIHQARIPPADLVAVDSYTLTGIGRTICDVARTAPLHEAVCALDSGQFVARRRGEPLDLGHHVDAMRRQHGISRLRTAAALSTDLAESIGESLSRCVIVDDGRLPAPELQSEVVVDDGSVKRCDFGWRDANGRLLLVGEFDGRFKYHRLSAASGHRLAEDVIYQEKLREDAIRDRGIIVVRWTWKELTNPEAFIGRLLRALRRAGIVR
ncbi:hypothetical protein ACPXB3_11635 [Gordonia sp. DT219]|uniref:hypothetical protein n=1 Tax=Gordonia sp. DT219 TaxID=3416658 RepID=UPI003CF47038